MVVSKTLHVNAMNIQLATVAMYLSIVTFKDVET